VTCGKLSLKETELLKIHLEECYQAPFKVEAQGDQISSLGMAIKLDSPTLHFTTILKERKVTRFRKFGCKTDNVCTLGALMGEVKRFTHFTSDNGEKEWMLRLGGLLREAFQLGITPQALKILLLGATNHFSVKFGKLIELSLSDLFQDTI